ncbi:MAG: hypothetical protein HRU19_16680 [Pseudobacteriovorax sp.]|nr:hypothetical protein [Pseudobacteriovorax sp.]
MYRRFLIFVLAFMSSSLAFAQDRVDIDVSQSSYEGRFLGKYTSWYRGNESIDTVTRDDFASEFIPGNQDLINVGTTDDVVWYKFRLTNLSDQSRSIFLYEDFNVTEIAEVYKGRELVGEIVYSDTLYERKITLAMKPYETATFYYKKRTQGAPNQSSWTLWSDLASVNRHISKNEKQYTVMQTIFTMSLLVTTMFLFAYRRKVYFYYMGYLASLFFYTNWIWATGYIPWITEHGQLLIISLSIFSILFVAEFLEIKRNSKFMLGFYRSLLALFLLTIFVFFAPFHDGEYSVLMIVSFSSLFVLGTVSYSLLLFLRKKERHIFLVSIAFGSFLTAISIQYLMWYDYIPLLSNNLVLYGSTIENLLMLVAMGDKIRLTQKSLIDSYQEVQHSYQQLGKVFYPHQIDLVQQGSELETTMPTHPSNGFVISFDIVGSSSLKHRNLKEFLEKTIGDCMNILREGYDPSLLCSNGYRIKEMGDGFLCSVGYPFSATNNLKAADLALTLTERFVQVLDLCAEDYGFDEPVFCGMGVAFGNLQGYYPMCGTKEYDLFGRGIILATRYEAMRKLILTDSSGHKTFLQTEVYEQLSEPLKKHFKLFQLPEGKRVRDDNASELYYRIYNPSEENSNLKNAS